MRLRRLPLVLMAMLWAVTTLLGNNPLSRPARAQAPAWSQQQEEQPGPYFALVIGIDEYPKLNKQSQLKTAVKDAEEIARILREDYEFEVVLLRNREANRDGIMSALNSVNRKLSKDGNLLIYYAGHGKYDSQGRKAYWLAYDADEPDDNTHWISADEITAFFWRMSARHILIVSDSCYSGGLSMREAHPGFTESDWDKYVQKMIQGSSRTLMSSGGLEPVEDDHGGDHSVFANALIRGLAQMTPDTFPARNLFNDFIQVRVGGSSEQMPQYDFIRNSAQEYGGGDFVFLRKKQAAATGDAERQRQQCDRQIISACLNLSSLYRNGTGVDKNEERAGELQEKALTLQRRACDAGSGQQCLNLGYEHEFGRLGAPVDTDLAGEFYKRARELFRRDCEQGHAEGCQGLGTIYESGNGLPKNEKLAGESYKKACDLLDLPSCRRLSFLQKPAGDSQAHNFGKAKNDASREKDDGSANPSPERKKGKSNDESSSAK